MQHLYTKLNQLLANKGFYSLGDIYYFHDIENNQQLQTVTLPFHFTVTVF